MKQIVDGYFQLLNVLGARPRAARLDEMSALTPSLRSHPISKRRTNMQRRTFGLLASLLLTATFMAPATGSAQDIQERTLKFPSASNKGHPQVMGVLKFAELVEEKSGGKITVKAFPGGVLGPDLQTVSAAWYLVTVNSRSGFRRLRIRRSAGPSRMVRRLIHRWRTPWLVR